MRKIGLFSILGLVTIMASCGQSSPTENDNPSVNSSSTTTVVETTESEEPEIPFVEVEENVPSELYISNGFIEIEGQNPRWWVEYQNYIGDIPQETVDEISLYLLENDWEGRLFLNNIDSPSEVDLYTLYHGAQREDVSAEEIANTSFDVIIYPLDEINDHLYRMFGMTNDEFDDPLYVQNIDGQDCVVIMVSDDVGVTNYNFVGGYLEDGIYTMYDVGFFVRLEADDDGGYRVLSAHRYDYTSMQSGETLYDPNRYYDDHDLDGYSEYELEMLYYEYYARHGVIFEDPEVQLYFEYTTWYNGTISEDEFDEIEFNRYEAYNIEFVSGVLGR